MSATFGKLPFPVDTWAAKPGVSKYFLTHMHSDHTQGLCDGWSAGTIYCSAVSRTLLLEEKRISPDLVVPLDVGITHIVKYENASGEEDTFNVTLWDANHCPGAVMFYFEGSFGAILHTGDFRFRPEMLEMEHFPRKRVVELLILDNTYCDPRHAFPPREQAAEEIIDIVKRHFETHKVLIGIDSLGKEDLLVLLAKTFRTKLLVDAKRLSRLKLLKINTALFTTDESDPWMIRVVARWRLTETYLANCNTREPTIGIIASGFGALTPDDPSEAAAASSNARTLSSRSASVALQSVTACLFAPQTDAAAPPAHPPPPPPPHPPIFRVPYSLHSNFDELFCFVRALAPAAIIGIVKPFESVLLFSHLLGPSPPPCTRLQLLGQSSSAWRAQHQEACRREHAARKPLSLAQRGSSAGGGGRGQGGGRGGRGSRSLSGGGKRRRPKIVPLGESDDEGEASQHQQAQHQKAQDGAGMDTAQQRKGRAEGNAAEARSGTAKVVRGRAGEGGCEGTGGAGGGGSEEKQGQEEQAESEHAGERLLTWKVGSDPGARAATGHRLGQCGLPVDVGRRSAAEEMLDVGRGPLNLEGERGRAQLEEAKAGARVQVQAARARVPRPVPVSEPAPQEQAASKGPAGTPPTRNLKRGSGGSSAFKLRPRQLQLQGSPSPSPLALAELIVTGSQPASGPGPGSASEGQAQSIRDAADGLRVREGGASGSALSAARRLGLAGSPAGLTGKHDAASSEGARRSDMGDARERRGRPASASDSGVGERRVEEKRTCAGKRKRGKGSAFKVPVKAGRPLLPAEELENTKSLPEQG